VGGGGSPTSLRSPGLVALGLIGAVVALLVIWSPAVLSSFGPPPPLPARILVAACGGSVLLLSALSGSRVQRWELLWSGAVALGVLALLVAIPDPVAMAVLILLLGALHATLPGRRSFVLRMRGPAAAALILGFAWLCVQTSSVGAHRVAGLGLALAIAAAAGLVPFAQDLDPEEPPTASCVTWAGFLAPALALALPARVLPLNGDERTFFSATLIGLGLLNLAWGTIGAWRAGPELEAWRHSFLADWGLARVGLGMGGVGAAWSRAARAAAFLALPSVVPVRFPLFLWARQVGPVGGGSGLGTLNVLLGAALSGAAPFAGFPVRLLLLRAATRESWPLAAALLAAMVVWVVHAFRLGRTLGRPSGRLAVAIAVTLSLSLVLGLASGALVAVGRP